MAVFSRLDIPCQAYVHPWEDSCVSAAMELFPSCIKESCRIYFITYTVALLMRGKVPSKNELKKTFLGMARSVLFLSLHGPGFPAFICLMRRFLGDFNFLSVAFFPKFFVSIITILIERESRRGLLSLYVTNVASETLFRMAVSRKMIKPLPYGEVLLFAASTSYLLYYFKGLGLPKDPVYSLLKFLVGPYEEFGYSKMDEFPYPPKLSSISKYDNPFVQFYKVMQNKWNEFVYKVKTFSSHPSCPHAYSCAHYALSSSLKKFFIGSGLFLSLKIVMSLKKILISPLHLKKILFKKENFSLGLCFGLFTGLFRWVSCLLRRWQGRDSEFFALPAGFLAGLAFYFYRDSTIALYFMWKTFQISYNVGVDKGYLPEIPYANVLFYALSTATLFHVAMLEPHNLRPSYWRFLHAMSGGRVARMDRLNLDAFGLKTSESLAKAMEGLHRGVHLKKVP